MVVIIIILGNRGIEVILIITVAVRLMTMAIMVILATIVGSSSRYLSRMKMLPQSKKGLLQLLFLYD